MMLIRRPVMLACLALVSSACAGEVTTQGFDDDRPPVGEVDPNATGEQVFAQSVQPLVRGKGQCTICHEGANAPNTNLFGEAGEADDYAAVVGNSKLVGSFNSGIALLIHQPAHGTYWWNEEDKQALATWLTHESTLRDGGNGGGTAGPTINELLSEWAGCMTLDNWNKSDMDNWQNFETDDGDRCYGCHYNGIGYFYVGSSRDETFAMQRTKEGIRSFFTAEVDANGVAAVVPGRARIESKGRGVGGTNHPLYNPITYLGYLDAFNQLTITAQENGQCDPPGFIER